MKILKTKSVASVELAEVEISIDELQVFEIALNYATKTLDEKEIERLYGASKAARDNQSGECRACMETRREMRFRLSRQSFRCRLQCKAARPAQAKCLQTIFFRSGVLSNTFCSVSVSQRSFSSCAFVVASFTSDVINQTCFIN